MRSSAVSGSGANTGTPSVSTRLCVSRSCHGAVSTIAVSRSAASASISLDLARHAKRVEQQQPFVVRDRVGRDVLVPRLARLPVRVRRLPVPKSRPHLAHDAMLLVRAI
jgi:hypothetical protein